MGGREGGREGGSYQKFTGRILALVRLLYTIMDTME
jgi:hypothetical protein